MTRTLILTRHAKSSWDHPALDDHSRPLNKRGRASAKAIGGWLSDKHYLPDAVLSSDSIRTRETWDRMGLTATQTVFTRDLYHTDAQGMMHALNQATGHCVLMLGHNPGISHFAEQVVKASPPHDRFFDYPTCATTVIAFPVEEWADVTWQKGTVLDFVIPRELLV
ncbi:SixA phosphatase family protein [Ruegeria jejuensis]|uniref:SixA phosphatase family protein n=1 Tax=Ruegeria jejuensis TaxID=3233338 RepID=UPI00355B5086